MPQGFERGKGNAQAHFKETFVAIEIINAQVGVGSPDTAWLPIGNSVTALAGDVIGETTAGLAGRLNSHGGGTAITAGGGVFGILQSAATSDANGRITTPATPTGVDPSVPAILAMPSYNNRVPPASPIAGVRRSQVLCYLASNGNYFIQRHKVGTRVNISLCGKLCDLTWNDTTGEWEVDTTSTSVNEIVVAPASLQLPYFRDNFTRNYWDSATYASDTLAGWLVFQFAPGFDASKYGLRYASITS